MGKRLYNLDGFRFLAALTVLLSHLETLKLKYGLPSLQGSFVSHSAQIAVSFFFVLSGFLISYLLIIEKRSNTNQRISLVGFYRKRIRRIWPLYYLLVAFVFFILPRFHFLHSLDSAVSEPVNPGKLVGYILFCPNTTGLIYGNRFMLEQTWTLGVEEFFYLLFPLMIYFFRDRLLPLLMVGGALLYIGATLFMMRFSFHMRWPLSIAETEYFYFNRYRLYAFLFGAAAAWFLLTPSNNRLYSLLRNKWATHVLLLLVMAIFITGFMADDYAHYYYCFLFALLLFSSSVSGFKYPVLNSRLLVYFGRISYGIYMLHPLVILFVLYIYRKTEISLPHFLLQFLAVLFTILIAAIVYELYEKQFLRRNHPLKKEIKPAHGEKVT